MFCGRTKEFLRQKGVDFEEHDITREEEAFARLQELGAYATPVTVIDGDVVIGFDRDRLTELLD